MIVASLMSFILMTINNLDIVNKLDVEILKIEQTIETLKK